MSLRMTVKYYETSIWLLETFTDFLPDVLRINISISVMLSNTGQQSKEYSNQSTLNRVSHSLRWNVYILLCSKICQNICEATWGPNVTACPQLKQTIGKHIEKELWTDLRQAVLLSLHWWHVCVSLQMVWPGKGWLDLADPAKICKVLAVQDLKV